MKKLLLAGMMVASFNVNAAANLLIEHTRLAGGMFQSPNTIMSCKIYDTGKVNVDIQTYDEGEYDLATSALIGKPKINVKTLFSSTATFKFDKKYITELVNTAEIQDNSLPSSGTPFDGETYVIQNKKKMKIVQFSLTPKASIPKLNSLIEGVCYQHGIRELIRGTQG